MKLNKIYTSFLISFLILFEAKAADPVNLLLESERTEEKASRTESEQRYPMIKRETVHVRGEDGIYSPADSWVKWTEVYQKNAENAWRLLPPQDVVTSLIHDNPSFYAGCRVQSFPGGPWEPLRTAVYKDRFPFLPTAGVLRDKDLFSFWGDLRYKAVKQPSIRHP